MSKRRKLKQFLEYDPLREGQERPRQPHKREGRIFKLLCQGNFVLESLRNDERLEVRVIDHHKDESQDEKNGN